MGRRPVDPDPAEKAAEPKHSVPEGGAVEETLPGSGTCSAADTGVDGLTATEAAGSEGRGPGATAEAAGSEGRGPGATAEPTVPLEQHQRLLAEFDNYRKRIERDRDRAAAWIRAELLGKLLPTMDDIDRARLAAGEDKKLSDMDGMLIIMNRLAELLKREGLVEIQAGPGDVFDPNIHEAVLMVPSAEVSEGRIAAVLEKGYRVGDRLLRPTKVAVASAPNAEEAQARAE